MGQTSKMIDWVVVLEVVSRPTGALVDADVLRRLLELLSEAEPGGTEPVALHVEGRYALHLSVKADHIAEAVMIAVFRWGNACSRLGLSGWDATRAEAITREDFDEEALALVDHTWGLREA
jgi:hypothetical protein